MVSCRFSLKPTQWDQEKNIHAEVDRVHPRQKRRFFSCLVDGRCAEEPGRPAQGARTGDRGWGCCEIHGVGGWGLGDIGKWMKMVENTWVQWWNVRTMRFIFFWICWGNPYMRYTAPINLENHLQVNVVFICFVKLAFTFRGWNIVETATYIYKKTWPPKIAGTRIMFDNSWLSPEIYWKMPSQVVIQHLP